MKELLSGNEAVARGAWEAGVALGTGYPGTPSSEILETLALLPGAKAQWCANEKVALEVASGAAWAGARALVTMKHVGLNVAADPLFTLAYTGVRGGLVVAVADDPGLQSSQNEQDSRHYGRAAKLPILEPSDSQEAHDFTLLAFRLSEEFDLPVILRLTTRVSHSRCPVKAGKRRAAIAPLALVKDARKQVMIPAYARARHVLLEEKMRALSRRAETMPINRLEKGRGPLKIVSSGVAYQYCREVAPDASCLKLGMVYPLPKRKLINFSRGSRKVFIVEELDPFLETEIKSFGLPVRGKRGEYGLGELNPERVRALLASRPERPPASSPLPARPPMLCPGCPHRAVFTVLKKLKLFVTGDIGCYTLGTLPPLSALDSCVCMGAGIGQSEGMRLVLPPAAGKKVVAVIGDSTFVHSGITGLVDLVYNGNGGVVIILDNQTTAMTGLQGHPGTGTGLGGRTARQVRICEICRGAGVNRVKILDPYDLKGVEAYLRESLPLPEPSVLIARAPCLLLRRHEKKPAHRVKHDLCRACSLCLQIACPALVPSPEGKPKITAALCSGCGACAHVCPAGAIGEGSDQ